jgi:hypothetical protein
MHGCESHSHNFPILTGDFAPPLASAPRGRRCPLWVHLRTSRRRRLSRRWCRQRTFAIPAKPDSGRPRVPPPGRIRSTPHLQIRTRSSVCADDESRHAILAGTTSARPTGRRSWAAFFVRYIFSVILRSKATPLAQQSGSPAPDIGTHARRQQAFLTVPEIPAWLMPRC